MFWLAQPRFDSFVRLPIVLPRTGSDVDQLYVTYAGSRRPSTRT